MLTSVVTFYDNETGPSSTASLLYPPRRPSFLIANLELEIQITAAFPITSNFLIANILRFLALRHEGFVLHFRAMPLSQILIETPRLKIRITRPISTTSNFLIETEWGFAPQSYQRERLFRFLLTSRSLITRYSSVVTRPASVSPCLRGQSLR